MCVMCSTSVPTLFQYFFYDHIPTFLYIFHEMFFITCLYTIIPSNALKCELAIIVQCPCTLGSLCQHLLIRVERYFATDLGMAGICTGMEMQYVSHK